MNKARARRLPWDVLAAAAIGVLAYGFWYGRRALDPGAVDWLAGGDPGTAFLGMHYFRHEPWGFPLGLVKGYGEGLGASVFSTDSLPLLAFLLKLASPLLDGTLQYFGLWTLACYVLTALFANAILARAAVAPGARLAGVCLLLLMPYVAWRATWHLALVAQWEILAAIWLYLFGRGCGSWARWGALLAVAALTHFYLFVIVGLVWIAALVAASRATTPEGRLSHLHAAGVAIFTIAGVGVLLWVAGAFQLLGHASAWGYGFNQFDLTSFFDPRGTSRFYAGTGPISYGRYEDFQFLGTGVVAATAAAAILWLTRPIWPARRLAPLLIAAALLLAFAASHRVTLANRVLLEVPLPQSILDLANVFRASARMAWLAGHLLVLGAVVVIARRLPTKVATAVLALCVVVGIYDGLAQRASTLEAMLPKALPLKRAQVGAVNELPDRVRRLESVPAYQLTGGAIGDIWGYALAAAPRGISLNLAYLARTDDSLFTRLQRNALTAALAGRMRDDTAYLTRNLILARALCSGATDSVVAGVGADFLVLARTSEGKTLPGAHSCLASAVPRPAAYDLATGAAGEGRFYLAAGWSSPQEWGVWSDGATAQLILPAPLQSREAQDFKLGAEFIAYAVKGGEQVIDVVVNEQQIATWRMARRGTPEWRHAQVPAAVIGTTGALIVDFRIRHPAQPSAEPGPYSHDSRFLGVGLRRVKVE